MSARTLPPEALALLRAAVDASTISGTARRLDVSTTSVSLLLSGKYGASTAKMAALIVAVLGRVPCPYLQEEISGAQCIEFHGRAAPTSSPYAMRHWRACQTCPHRRAK